MLTAIIICVFILFGFICLFLDSQVYYVEKSTGVAYCLRGFNKVSYNVIYELQCIATGDIVFVRDIDLEADYKPVNLYRHGSPNVL